MGIKKDKNTEKLGVWDSTDRDKIEKETKTWFRGRRILEMWYMAKDYM